MSTHSTTRGGATLATRGTTGIGPSATIHSSTHTTQAYIPITQVITPIQATILTTQPHTILHTHHAHITHTTHTTQVWVLAEVLEVLEAVLADTVAIRI